MGVYYVRACQCALGVVGVLTSRIGDKYFGVIIAQLQSAIFEEEREESQRGVADFENVIKVNKLTLADWLRLSVQIRRI